MNDAEDLQDPAGDALVADAERALEWPVLLGYIAGLARSEPGRERIETLELAPTLEEARVRMLRVSELLNLESARLRAPAREFPGRHRGPGSDPPRRDRQRQ